MTEEDQMPIEHFVDPTHLNVKGHTIKAQIVAQTMTQSYDSCHMEQIVLAEPGINGLSGTALPFGNKSFDVIVACHVLEHIPVKDRDQFLDQLCSKARKYVIILNPFYKPKSYVEERLKVIVELTNA